MTHLTQRSNRVFLAANTKAKELKSSFVDSEHILHGLLSDGEIYKVLVELKVQPQMVEIELAKLYKRENNTAPPQMSPRVKKIVDDSLVLARKLGFEFIAPEHILSALFEEGEGVGARVLVKLGLKKDELLKKVQAKKPLSEEEKKEADKKKVLQQYTIDLTAKAAQGLLDPVVERSEVIERVIHILSRRTKNNPSLVGEAGVGKTAIVEGLAQRIVTKQVPEPLLNKKILQLDLMSVLAGASHRGDFEERMKNLIEEVKNSQGQIILFIDEIHNIVGAGSSGDGALDASNFLKPALARGELQMIGATTLTEYRKYVEKDPALERRFQPVLVPEPTEEQAIKMLKAIRDKYEAFHKVKIPDEAVDAAVHYSKRYVGDRFLPDKAVDLIDEAASAVRLPLISLPEEIKSLEDRIAQLTQEKTEAEKRSDKVKSRILNSKISDITAQLNEKKEQYNLKKAQTTTAVSESIIKDIIARWTGIPISKITASEKDKLANLEKIMHERLIDQDVAVAAVAAAVRRGRAGLKSTQRPIGSFIFLGPTGVGKTELAKTLADILFGQEEAMVRFDMTEYMEKHEVAKLLGAPPGYVGYDEGGKLTEAVRRKPYSVILFDEVEKAHPDIFNILLQILDDGRLTDNKGRTISFKNTVVICTSNLGSGIIQQALQEQGKETASLDEAVHKKIYEDMKSKVMPELTKFFRPELINRFDEVIVFEPLRLQHMVEIVKLQLKSLAKLLEDQDIGISYSDDVVEEIVQAGFDPVYGARPLKRAIQRLLENPISTLIIEGKVKPGNVIHVAIEGGDFVFPVEQTEIGPGSSASKKKFLCANCANKFETEVNPHATTICSNCSSKNVHEAQDEKNQEIKSNANLPDEKSDVQTVMNSV
ncbi:ATP-dependent Clp protease ATP-binding subunit [Candidatus Roizmanbacteria bacterium]|nr:ATP-dependent Clp protease ATP-binding subunit [Candidatus Roizmanbacteria bacterium]